MSNVIDLKQYQKLRNNENLLDIPEEDSLESEGIQEEISERYLKAINEIEFSFCFAVTEEQGEQIKAAFLEVQKSYERILLDSVSESTNKTVQLHFLNKYS
ncbi:hypothetical protein UB33_21330 [Photobacterium angustum]|uniref:hypothetical protein n=1 Tax=Photobacterium angustum TaxID=661 RepID=UPI0005E82AA7|nr:hypothetical protein [Photobacterium angustum]KJG03981.1 hypothetical protein UB33_21330 [Photobacterium angustum]PSV89566.1 hypothetical protein CTN01_18055 [Photobacterium angustum]